jgi:hypothetical protein
MRDVVLALGLATVWLVGTPIMDARHKEPVKAAEAPAWLAIPLNADITEVSRSRTGPAGHLNAVTDLPAAAVVQIMKTRLALQGFEIIDRSADLTGTAGAATAFQAANPTDGRLATAVVVDTPTGAVLRIDFSEQETVSRLSSL